MKCLLAGGYVFFLLLAGCAQTSPPPAAPAFDPGALQSEMQSLPGADVGENGIVYPQGSLFSAGAALFYAGGTNTLGPLSALLQRHPQVRWQGAVHAESSVSKDHALALATTRARLLHRYFSRKGIDGARLSLKAEGGGGPDMTLQPIFAAQDEKDSSSSRENE